MLQQNGHVFPVADSDRSSDIDSVLTDIADLRSAVIAAWQDRAVLFTPEDQRRLRDEVAALASLLHDLTLNA